MGGWAGEVAMKRFPCVVLAALREAPLVHLFFLLSVSLSLSLSLPSAKKIKHPGVVTVFFRRAVCIVKDVICINRGNQGGCQVLGLYGRAYMALL